MFRLCDKLGFRAYYKNDEPEIGENINDITIRFAFEIVAKIGYGISYKRSFQETVAKWLTFFALLSMIFLTTVALFGATTSELVKILQSCVPILQTVGRLLVLSIGKKDFIQLNENIAQFWKIESVPKAERDSYLKTYKLQNYAFQSYLIICISLGLLFFLVPFFKILPFYCWIPFNNTYCFWMIIALEWMFICCATFIAMGYDMIFVANCTAIYNQFKLLQAKLTNFDFAESNTLESLQTLNEYIRYHNFLLICAAHIEKAFTIHLLGLYLLGSFNMCVYAIVFALIKLSNVELIQAIVITLSTVLQLSFYIFPLHEVSSEAEKVSEAFFHSKWYELNGNAKKNLVLAILRSQKRCKFTAGGFVTIERVIVIQIMKLSFSIWTLARKLKTRE